LKGGDLLDTAAVEVGQPYVFDRIRELDHKETGDRNRGMLRSKTWVGPRRSIRCIESVVRKLNRAVGSHHVDETVGFDLIQESLQLTRGRVGSYEAVVVLAVRTQEVRHRARQGQKDLGGGKAGGLLRVEEWMPKILFDLHIDPALQGRTPDFRGCSRRQEDAGAKCLPHDSEHMASGQGQSLYAHGPSPLSALLTRSTIVFIAY
jgi:hypothetical protein